MTAKITATRQAAFLKALAQTGNQTLSAERAKVSRSWVLLHRKRDAGFDAAVREAVREARERLRGFSTLRQGSGQASLEANGGDGKSGTTPPSGWGHLDEVELVVRGTGGSGGGKRVQIARARLHQWDARVEERFLATLAATCNVRAACAEVGMSATSAYEHRKRWRGFARRWDEAEEIADSRIGGALTARGLNLFSRSGEVNCETPIPKMTVAEAIHVLAMHQRRTRGIGKRPGRSPREPTIEEVREEVIRRLAAIRRARGVSEADKARDREVYARRRGWGGRHELNS